MKSRQKEHNFLISSCGGGDLKNLKFFGHHLCLLPDELDISGGLCTGPVDLATEDRASTRWNVTDAAMSIEVAEHIPAQFEANFVNNLGTYCNVQGDTSGRTKPPVDIKAKVAFQYNLFTLKHTSCFDFNGRFGPT